LESESSSTRKPTIKVTAKIGTAMTASVASRFEVKHTSTGRKPKMSPSCQRAPNSNRTNALRMFGRGVSTLLESTQSILPHSMMSNPPTTFFVSANGPSVMIGFPSRTRTAFPV
jgi:hypothetical protein